MVPNEDGIVPWKRFMDLKDEKDKC